MFSLIISIISVALVAALIFATTYYMGTVVTKQQAKADASQFIAGGEQIAAAFVLSTFNGGNPNVWINTLVPEYLSELPTYSCLVGDDVTWPLAFYKVINEKNI